MIQIAEYLLSKKHKSAISEELSYVIWASFDVFEALDKKYPDEEFQDNDFVCYWILTDKEIVETLKEISEEKILKQFKAYEVPKDIDVETLKKKIISGDIKRNDLKGTTYEHILQQLNV